MDQSSLALVQFFLCDSSMPAEKKNKQKKQLVLNNSLQNIFKKLDKQGIWTLHLILKVWLSNADNYADVQM